MSVQTSEIDSNLEQSNKQVRPVSNIGNQTFYQSPFNLFNLFVSLFITFVFAIYTVYQHPWTTEWIELMQIDQTIIKLPIPLFGIIPIFIFAVIVHRLWDYKMILCAEYVLLVEGLMRWREKSHRIHYEKIQEIDIQQTILQRAFNIGDVHVMAVTGEHSLLKMPGVYNPRRLKDAIEHRIKAHTKN